MTEKVEFIESYIKNGTGDYKWNYNHGELVRCADCIHFNNPIKGVPFCKHIKKFITVDWYCADGKRKKDILSSMYGIQGGSNNGETL